MAFHLAYTADDGSGPAATCYQCVDCGRLAAAVGLEAVPDPARCEGCHYRAVAELVRGEMWGPGGVRLYRWLLGRAVEVQV